MKIAPDYCLTADELPSIRSFLALEGALGSSAPKFTSDSIFAMMESLHTLSGSFGALKNPTFQQLTIILYTALAEVETSFGLKFPALFASYLYSTTDWSPSTETIQIHFELGFSLDQGAFIDGTAKVSIKGEPPIPNVTVKGSGLPVKWSGGTCFSGDSVFLLGGALEYQVGARVGTDSWSRSEERHFPGMERPSVIAAYAAAPPPWEIALAAAVDDLKKTKQPWVTLPPSPIPQISETVASKVLTPTVWTNVENVKAAAQGAIGGQTAVVKEMLEPQVLDAMGYFFMLHMLISIGNGDLNAQALTLQIIQSSTSSPEYPNDTFANQLIYLSLMHLADPNGQYIWDNSQLQTWVAATADVVVNDDPASAELKASLTNSGTLLHVDSAYPLQDPNAPTFSFDTRLSDTIFALDKARALICKGKK